MPTILDRGEGNSKRKERLAKLKKGTGIFIYDGGACDTEWTPTPKLIGKDKPSLDSQGMPVLDGTGRQQFERAGLIERDSKGQPVMGGAPKVIRHKLDVFVVRGVKFPTGKPVTVGDSSLALKLRGMDFFTETETDVIGEDEPEGEKDLGDMTKAELLAMADAEGVEAKPAMSKGEIIELLEAKSVA